MLQMRKSGRSGREELKYSSKQSKDLVITLAQEPMLHAVLLHAEVAFYVFEDCYSSTAIENINTRN